MAQLHPESLVMSVDVGLEYRKYVDAYFLQTAFSEGLMTMRGSAWATQASLQDAPGELVASAEYFHGATEEALVRLADGLCQLILSERSLTVRIAASSRMAADRALDAIATALPEVAGGDRRVAVTFWWWQPMVARKLARMMPSMPWDEIECNYVSGAYPVRWRPPSPASSRVYRATSCQVGTTSSGSRGSAAR